MDLTNFKGFLDYPGLDYYDEKNKTWTEEKIAVETERAKTAESTLTTNLNNEISRAKKAEENNATSIDNEVTRATNAENTLATNLSSHTSNKSNPHGVTKAQVGLGNVDNTSDANKPISTATQTALNAKAPLASPTLTGTPKAPTATAGTNTTQIATTAFVQTEIGNLINGAPETANTLKELSDLIEEHQDVTDALNAAIGNKVDKVDGKGLSTNDYTTTEKTKLSGIATGAEVNQNAFSNVVVGSTTIAADSKTDTLTLTAGSNVTITPDATNDKITISSSHPTISKSTNTTSTASPSAGGTFTAIDSITQDSNGHVTKFNTKTVTLPSTPVTIDSALSATSTNPVQNKVISTELNNRTYNYGAPFIFGATQESTLLDMINLMAVESSVSFWINNTNAYVNVYNEVMVGCNKHGFADAYGIVTIEKINGITAYVTWRSYENTYKAMKISYSAINNVGWSEWEKIATSSDLDIIGECIIRSYVEVGFNENIVVGASLCLKKLSKTKCDLHISYKIWSNNVTDNSIFSFISGEKLRNALGVSSLLCHNPEKSQVVFIPSINISSSNGTVNIVTSETTENIMGLSGLKAHMTDEGIKLGRVYQESGNYGSWEVNKEYLFKAGSYGQINFYGADYSI